MKKSIAQDERKKALKAEAQEHERKTRIARLTGELKDKYQIDLKAFALSQILPSWALLKDGRTIGFCEIIVGPREDYTQVKASAFRAGVFCTEHFAIEGTEDNRMRYLIFLLTPDTTYKWTYNSKRAKPLPTLNTEEALCVCIKKTLWELL